MGFRDNVIQIIKQIPYGKVTTYGTISTLAGSPRGARLVGGILHYGDENLPWYRIINKQGFISTNCTEHPKELQRALLEDEKIEVSEDFMVDLDRYGWWGQ